MTPPDRAAGRLARSTRAALHDELLAVADGRKLPWFGPPMSAASMATARLMETWAHGLDVADALGVKRPADGAAALDRAHRRAHPRLRVHRERADAARRSRSASSCARPTASTWSWGPDDAAQRVTGSAEDFCMLVTQRRPRAALDVTRSVTTPQKWLTIAQAFAGPPGPGSRS